MRAKVKRVHRLRRFTEEFKKSIVREYDKGRFTVAELCTLYQLSDSCVYRWIQKYSEYEKQGVILVEMKDSSLMRVKELQNRIKDLEQIVGQKQIKIDFLEKMIELSKSEFGIDVKKKSTMPHLSGLEISKNS